MVEILLLRQDDCVFCEQARGVLERLAAEFPLAIRDVDFDSTRGHTLAEQGGILFAPGVFVDGEPFSYGRLSERKLRRQLQRVTTRTAGADVPGSGRL